MGHIFISYSRKDEEYVNKLVVALENEGFEVWIDRELMTGDTWIQVINHKIDTCDAFVIVMTDDSKESTWVRREVLYAIQEGKKIFPLLLQGKLWMYLQDFNFFKVINGSIPDRKFFRDIEKTVSRSEAWLAVQREAAEKVRLEAEEQERQKAAKEKAEHETAQREKTELKAIEKAEREKENKRRLEKALKKAQRDFWWEKLKIDIRYRFRLIYIYRVPILILLGTLAFVTPLLIRLFNLIPEVMTTLNNIPTATIGSTFAPQSSTNSTDAFIPLKTLTPNPTSTEVLVLTPTSLPTEITDSKGVSMVLVPAGEFTMGNNRGGDAQPIHNVYLNDFYIDAFEVTNMLYKTCVEEGGCSPLPNAISNTYDNYPVINVDWEQSKTYCEWRGGNLPSEAQWEKAARGVDGLSYPWGDEFMPEMGNFCDKNCNNYWRYDGNDDGYGTLAPVGNYINGKSPYGIYDMAGNVWEWVADWYSESYYQDTPKENPLGPDSGQFRVIRGASWLSVNLAGEILSSNRGRLLPSSKETDVGFRCAKDLQ